MAITTDNEKYSTLAFNCWTVPSGTISSDGLDSADKKQLLRGYPTLPYDPGPDPVSGNVQWITRYRRRGRR